MQKIKWVNFGLSPVYQTLRPGWGTKPLLPLSVFLQFSLNWKQKPTVSQQRGDLKVKGQIPLYHGSFWHAESQPMWLETLTDKRRALRREVKPASESSPLTDDHKTIEKRTKRCSSSVCHVYTQTFRQKAALGGIFKALGWWLSTWLTLQPSWNSSWLLVHVGRIKYNGSITPFFMGRKPQCTSSSDFPERTQWINEKVRSPRTPIFISSSWSPIILSQVWLKWSQQCFALGSQTCC